MKELTNMSMMPIISKPC